MACLVLLADAAEENEAFIYSLWRRCIAELGDLEVAARSWQHRDTVSGNATVCAGEVCYNSKLCSITGSLPALAEQTQWHLQSIQCAHEEFLRSTCVNNINAFSLRVLTSHEHLEELESFSIPAMFLLFMDYELWTGQHIWSLGNTWIQATQSEDHETFKVTIDDPKDLSLANVS